LVHHPEKIRFSLDSCCGISIAVKGKAMNSKLACLLGVVLLASIYLAEAQQPKKVPRIGYLRQGSLSSAASEDDAFRQGLRDLGYVEGKNILIEYRYAEGKVDRVPDLATELVRLKLDAIVVGGDRATKAAKEATSTINWRCRDEERLVVPTAERRPPRTTIQARR
jgi:hypothetical protein